MVVSARRALVTSVVSAAKSSSRARAKQASRFSGRQSQLSVTTGVKPPSSVVTVSRERLMPVLTASIAVASASVV